MDIIEFDERCFPAPQPVPVREIKEEEIADVPFGNEGEEALNLNDAEMLDGTLVAHAITTLPMAPLRTAAWLRAPALVRFRMNGDITAFSGFH
ncbi:MAG TPA: hypothetical protein VNA69_10135 [Thermoanaerobaculia bacterium]|nr:hypothetical protein [Thermoanaerobaculia bacterium]